MALSILKVDHNRAAQCEQLIADETHFAAEELWPDIGSYKDARPLCSEEGPLGTGWPFAVPNRGIRGLSRP